MSTTNTSNMDQSFDPHAAAELREKRKKIIENSFGEKTS